MYFNSRSIISSMQDACISYNNAINRVLDSWNDKVSESMRASCIGNLAKVGQKATDAMTKYGNTIENLLKEMEFYAWR